MLFKFKKKEYNSELKRALELFKLSNYETIEYLLTFFKEDDNKQKVIIAKALSEALENFTYSDIFKIDISIRKYHPDFYIDWKKYKVSDFIIKQMSNSEKRTVLIFLSMNSNGYIREEAVTLLSQYNDTLPFIIFRLNDWSVQVRTSAFLAYKHRIHLASDTEIVNSFPYFERLLRTTRPTNNDIYDIFYNKINSHSISDLSLRSRDFKIRKFYVNELLKQANQNIDTLTTHIIYEKDPFLRKVIFEKLLDISEDKTSLCLTMIKDKYCTNKSLGLRSLRLLNPELACEHGITLLLDNTLFVRETARNTLTKNNYNLDFKAFYIDNLKTKTNIAIKGLSEFGNKSHCEIIERYLDYDSISVKKASITALMMLDTSKYTPLVYDYLDSEDDSLITIAFHLINKHKIYDFDKIESVYNKVDSESKKLYCANLLLKESKWKRLIIILKLLNSDFKSVQYLAKIKTSEWLGNYNNEYAICTQSQKDQIH